MTIIEPRYSLSTYTVISKQPVCIWKRRGKYEFAESKHVIYFFCSFNLPFSLVMSSVSKKQSPYIRILTALAVISSTSFFALQTGVFQNDFLGATISEVQDATDRKSRRYFFDDIPLSPTLHPDVALRGNYTLNTSTGVVTFEKVAEARSILRKEMVQKMLNAYAVPPLLCGVLEKSERYSLESSSAEIGEAADVLTYSMEGTGTLVCDDGSEIVDQIQQQYGISLFDLNQFHLETFSVTKKREAYFGSFTFVSSSSGESVVLTPQ
jgi:hypothetical protein